MRPSAQKERSASATGMQQHMYVSTKACRLNLGGHHAVSLTGAAGTGDGLLPALAEAAAGVVVRDCFRGGGAQSSSSSTSSAPRLSSVVLIRLLLSEASG